MPETNFNFCPKKFHPFNASDLPTYVVPSENHDPVWEPPDGVRGGARSGSHPRFLPTYRRRDVINTYVRESGHDPRYAYPTNIASVVLVISCNKVFISLIQR